MDTSFWDSNPRGPKYYSKQGTSLEHRLISCSRDNAALTSIQSRNFEGTLELWKQKNKVAWLIKCGGTCTASLTWFSSLLTQGTSLRSAHANKRCQSKPLNLFLKHQNQWNLMMSDQDCWVYKEKDTNFCQPQWQLQHPWELLLSSLSFISHSRAGQKSPRTEKEKLLKLQPLSCIPFKNSCINLRKQRVILRQRKKFHIKILQEPRDVCFILAGTFETRLTFSFTSLPPRHKFPKGSGMNFKFSLT